MYTSTRPLTRLLITLTAVYQARTTPASRSRRRRRYTRVMSPAMALLLLSSTSLLASSVAATSADDCVLDLAIVCLDDKLLVYVNWLEKRDKLNVVGDIVTIIKKKEAGLAEDRSKLQPQNIKQHVHRVSTSLGPAIDEYFDTHTIRISLPWILDDDIDLELDQQGNYGYIFIPRCRSRPRTSYLWL